MLKIPRHHSIIAHRGASACAPENTMAAFEKARLLGCQAIECDVILSADGEPFVMHDTYLERTTNGQGVVAETTAASLDMLDAGSWFSKKFTGEKIPHLADLLEWCAFANVFLNLEIKPAPGKMQETVIAVLACIHRAPRHFAHPLISSFDWNALHLCRDLWPEALLGLLLERWEDDWESHAARLDVASVHIPYRAATVEHIAHIKARAYAVYVYTVNRRKQADQLFAAGVDAVFSDYPDLLSAR